jgi:hypothetical protein
MTNSAEATSELAAAAGAMELVALRGVAATLDMLAIATNVKAESVARRTHIPSS